MANGPLVILMWHNIGTLALMFDSDLSVFAQTKLIHVGVSLF